MTTSEPLNKINEEDVWKELTAIITGERDYWRLQISLILLYELTIVLISKAHGCDYVRDKVAAEDYGNDWYELLHVSNKFRHNYYDKELKIKYL